MITDVLKNMALFIDGRGYAGKADEIVPPKLTLKTEEYRAGGMDAPIEVDMGMEKLEASFTLSAFDKEVLKLFGLAAGNQVPMTFRSALEAEDGTITPVVMSMRGKIREVDMGTWKSGEKATLKVTMGLHYYKLTHGQDVVHEIDVENMIRMVNGTDQLANQRSALGI
ncbi:MAG: phage major tail tube protein [Gammaproteobacteria bacterium]|nr:phage major tail tube protein [Gammaproteobacteria bacterium]MDH5651693.1 phage major tail tube protein [Gammaproteobacteria bacterium]